MSREYLFSCLSLKDFSLVVSLPNYKIYFYQHTTIRFDYWGDDYAFKLFFGNEKLETENFFH